MKCALKNVKYHLNTSLAFIKSKEKFLFFSFIHLGIHFLIHKVPLCSSDDFYKENGAPTGQQELWQRISLSPHVLEMSYHLVGFQDFSDSPASLKVFDSIHLL